MPSGSEPLDSATQSVVLVLGVVYDRAGAVDEQLAQVRITALADPQQSVFAACPTRSDHPIAQRAIGATALSAHSRHPLANPAAPQLR